MDCREGGTEYGRFTMADGPGKGVHENNTTYLVVRTGPCSSPPTPWPGTGASTRPPSPRSASPRTAAAPALAIREDGAWFEDSDGPAGRKHGTGVLLGRPAVSPHPGTSPMTDDDIGPRPTSCWNGTCPPRPKPSTAAGPNPTSIRRFLRPRAGPRARGGGGALARRRLPCGDGVRRARPHGGRARLRADRPNLPAALPGPTRWDPRFRPNAEKLLLRRHHLHGSGRRLRLPRDRTARLQGGRRSATRPWASPTAGATVADQLGRLAASL